MKYEFPVKMHRFTTEEFNVIKAKYNAKYGYEMYIPGFSDIVKINIQKPPTDQEVKLYRKKDIEGLGAFRYEEIRKIMAAKKESFLRMMGSPNPTWIANIGTTMTWLDDINDSFGTLSVVFRTAAHLLPKSIAKVFMGPAGWALTVADIVNVAMTIFNAPLTYITAKADLAKASATNPFCKEAKVKRAKRLKKLKPSKGEIIEALQVTNSMFGIGLSLGPIMGAFFEAFTGPYRVLQGKKVTVKWPIPDLTLTEEEALKGLDAAFLLSTGGQELSPEDHTKIYLVAEMATHALYPLFQEYHPLDMIDGLENIILPAPKPKDPLTKLLFDEEGLHWPSHTGYLHINRQYVSVDDLMDLGNGRIDASFQEYVQSQKHTFLGQIGMQSVNNFTENILSLIEGEDQVVIDLHPVVKAMYKIIDNGFTMPDTTTDQQRQLFGEIIMYPPPKGLDPPFDMIRNSICPACGIKLIRRPHI